MVKKRGQHVVGSLMVSSTRVRPIYKMFFKFLFKRRGLRISTKVPNFEPLSSTKK